MRDLDVLKLPGDTFLLGAGLRCVLKGRARASWEHLAAVHPLPSVAVLCYNYKVAFVSKEICTQQTVQVNTTFCDTNSVCEGLSPACLSEAVRGA